MLFLIFVSFCVLNCCIAGQVCVGTGVSNTIVMSEIEVQNIELDVDYQFGGCAGSQQRISDSVQTFDTFSGGTELRYNRSQMILSESDDKTMEKNIFGAQTAKQSQRKYQDSMKDHPNSGVKRKTQKSVRFQIEKDNVIEAY
jgi:hypothetical protein